MKNSRNVIAAIGLLLAMLSAPALADVYWLRGTIVDVTATELGLMVRFENNAVPTSCAGVGSGWMLIPEANKTMVAFAMSKWIAQQRSVDIYVKGMVNGYCVVEQVDSA